MRHATWCVRAATVVLIATLGWLGSCTDSTAPGEDGSLGPDTPPPEGIILSDRITAASMATASRSGSVALTSADGELAYVSLPPGTVAGGAIADIHKVGASSSVLTAVVDGGFDPVAIPVQADDIVEVVVRNAAGAVVYSERVAVTPKRPPVVVRTHPPRKKTDVAINSSIVIVFSEPVASATVTSSSVKLMSGSSAIAGRVQVLPGAGTTVAFTPNAPLRANTLHRLVVTKAVTDLEGQALEADVVASFTTGTSTTGPAASITVMPDTVYMSTLTYQMTAMVRDASGNVLIDQPVTWATSDPGGLRVSSTGLLTALVEGGNNVVAIVGEITSGYAHIQVLSPESPVSVTVMPSTGTVAAVDTIRLSATIRDASGRYLRRQLNWSSSDPGVATVVSLGGGLPGEAPEFFAAVIGVRPGSVTITAASEGVSGTSAINVSAPKPVASVSVSPESAELVTRGTVTLKATPKDAAGRPIGRAVAWMSEHPSVATVDGNGLVTAVGVGSTSVIATSEGVSGRAFISVTEVTFASLSSGWSHVCALNESGAAYCWGGMYEPPSDIFFRSASPVTAARGSTFVSLTSGGGFTCGLTASGAAYCWGNNADGRLGIGSTATSSVTAEPVKGGLIFSALSAGLHHACGVTTTGNAYCWGNNGAGQLGNGQSSNSSSVPVAVAGNLKFVSVSAGSWQTCGLTVEGAAYCWGTNTSGELGSGTISGGSAVPVAVTGGHVYTALSAGGDNSQRHTCGITTSGAAYCWGENYWGQLGDGTGGATRSANPTPVRVSGDLTFSAVSTGAYFTCALTTTNSAYCWGHGFVGQLGDGADVNGRFSPTPVAVSGGLAFSALDAGGYHACGLSTSRVVYCWGWGSEGQLGNGSTANSNVPIKVAGQR